MEFGVRQYLALMMKNGQRGNKSERDAESGGKKMKKCKMMKRDDVELELKLSSDELSLLNMTNMKHILI